MAYGYFAWKLIEIIADGREVEAEIVSDVRHFNPSSVQVYFYRKSACFLAAHRHSRFGIVKRRVAVVTDAEKQDFGIGFV